MREVERSGRIRPVNQVIFLVFSDSPQRVKRVDLDRWCNAVLETKRLSSRSIYVRNLFLEDYLISSLNFDDYCKRKKTTRKWLFGQF